MSVLREAGDQVARMVTPEIREQLRAELERGVPQGTPTPTSVEIPLSAGAKQVLARTAAEADRFDHKHIGVEHLLIALSAEGSIVAAAMADHGLTLQVLRRIAGS